MYHQTGDWAVKYAPQTVEQLRSLLNETATQLPEYTVVMAMKGVGQIGRAHV